MQCADTQSFLQDFIFPSELSETDAVRGYSVISTGFYFSF
jgi:hypothetical protein